MPALRPDASNSAPCDTTTESTELSVVVVNYNTREATLECLASALANGLHQMEIIVVDNGSTDGSADAIRRRFPAVIVDEAGENLGFAKGVNRGVAQASGVYVLLLNPDTLVRPGSLAALVEFARDNPTHGVYGGRTLRRDGAVDPSSCWGAPTLWSLGCFALGLTTAFHGSSLFDPESLGRWKRDSVREVDIVTGCLLLMRREDWRAMGGMDETFFLYGEDAEFSIRAAKRGFRPVIVPDAVIIHDVGGSTSNSGDKMCMVMAGKVTLLRRSWGSTKTALGVSLLVAGAGLRAALQRAIGRRNGMWVRVWSRRDDWLPGYPAARVTLFGLPAAE